jgi:hypothetical protein
VHVLLVPTGSVVGVQLNEESVTDAETRLIEAVTVVPFQAALRFAVCPAVILPAVAAKVTEARPAGTVTEGAGTGSSALLPLRLTTMPPAGAAFDRLTVQLVEAPDPMLVGEQPSEESNTGATRLIDAVCDTALSVAVTVAL